MYFLVTIEVSIIYLTGPVCSQLIPSAPFQTNWLLWGFNWRWAGALSNINMSLNGITKVLRSWLLPQYSHVYIPVVPTMWSKTRLSWNLDFITALSVREAGPQGWACWQRSFHGHGFHQESVCCANTVRFNFTVLAWAGYVNLRETVYASFAYLLS